MKGSGNPFEDTKKTSPQIDPPHIELDINNIYPNIGTPPPTFTEITSAELNRRQTELNRLKAELNRREHGINGNLPPPNNWPPFAETSCFQPCFYQDINVEIPSEYQSIVINLYSIWKLYVLTLLGNVMGGFIILFGTGQTTTIILSIVNFILLTPISYLCWFRPAYNAFRNNSNVYFIMFFIGYLFQIQVTIYQTIGIPETGNCGFELAISEFSLKSFSRVFFGLLLFKIALCFAMCAVGNIIMITRVFNTYRIIRCKHRTETTLNSNLRMNN